MNITITRLNLDRAAIRSPYDARDDVKSLLGASWNPQLKAWLIPAGTAPAAAQYLRRCGWTVELVGWTDDAQLPAPVVRPWAESMFDALPAGLRAPAFRALAKVLHPDLGGDVGSMQVLATAYSKVGA